MGEVGCRIHLPPQTAYLEVVARFRMSAQSPSGQTPASIYLVLR